MNEEILKQVNFLVDTYGLPTAIIIILIVLFISLFKSKYFIDLTSKFFKNLINNNFNKKITNNTEKETISPTIVKVSESDIINHEIFNHIDFWLYSEIPTIEFCSKYRTVVFSKYLHIYYKAYKDSFHIFVNSGNYKTMNDSELRQALKKLIVDTIYKYESEMTLNGIPPIIINKMKVKNNDTLSLTFDLINSICDSMFYNSENNLLKIFSLLNIIISILENTIYNSREVCDNINGDLKGLSMGGFTEGVD